MRVRPSTLAIGLCAAGAVSAGVAAVALAYPTSLPARLAGLAGSSEAEAHALASRPEATSADLALARAATLRSLNQSPANATAWLRLAYIDSRGPEGLGPVGLDALSRSYAMAPYGPDDTGWRLRFAFNHWTRLDRPMRLMALEELAVATDRGDRALHGLAGDVTDPAGRLAVELTLADLQRRKAANAS